MESWLSHSLTRYYPASPAEDRSSLQLDGARGERLSFQALCRNEDDSPRNVAAAVAAPAGLDVRIRRIGWVPLPHFNTDIPRDELDGIGHVPGYVPDPLWPDLEVQVGAWETQGYWITVRLEHDAVPGAYQVSVTLTADGVTLSTLTATVVVHPATLRERRQFPVTHWFYADALLDWYRLEPFEERFWEILRAYFLDLVAHGQDTVYVPAFTPPLDGVKRPSQLLRVRRTGNRYDLDWSLVRRWVELAKACGLRYFEWTHLFTQWGARQAIRVYQDHGDPDVLLWPPETTATSPIYRTFLAQYLPELERFLHAEGLMDVSFFHLSDEPHGEEHLVAYRAARELLRELAPWMPVMDALSDIAFAREGLTDIPIPAIATAPDFLTEGFPAWVYFCCGPRGHYLNRLLDTPLLKIRLSGWLFYRLRARGFLHWGYNYWYESQTRHLIDPFQITDGMRWPGWAYGDTFVVYPGPDGPVDSLRWEIFAEGLQDYALLQAAGIDPDDASLADIIDFAEFPRDPTWLQARRAAVLTQLDAVTAAGR